MLSRHVGTVHVHLLRLSSFPCLILIERCWVSERHCQQTSFWTRTVRLLSCNGREVYRFNRSSPVLLTMPCKAKRGIFRGLARLVPETLVPNRPHCKAGIVPAAWGVKKRRTSRKIAPPGERERERESDVANPCLESSPQAKTVNPFGV